MRESDFIDKNKYKWEELEELLVAKEKDPERLSELFVQVTDDLSYARTFYPNRSVRVYLNNLAQRVYQSIYKSNKGNQQKFINFWKEELPLIVFNARKQFFISLILFILAFLIGILSSMHDQNFARTILGDQYIEMTKANIESGDPMAVYKQKNDLGMFSSITLNNIRVAFIIFICGVLYSVGSVGFLLYNGIMVGTFQYFFIERGLFQESFLTIWMHGTLEISSIIIAGAAGITMGKGIVFPGTFKRIQAFRITALKGLKILLGIIPVIVLAGFIETYFTRFTDAPDILRALFIFICLTFVIWYFIIYPLKVYKNKGTIKAAEVPVEPEKPYIIDLKKIKSSGEIFNDIFAFYKRSFRKILFISLFLSFLYSLIIAFQISGKVVDINFIPTFNWLNSLNTFLTNISQLFQYKLSPALFVLNVLIFALFIGYILFLWDKKVLNKNIKIMDFISVNFFKVILFTALIHSIFYIGGFLSFIIALILIPVIILFLSISIQESFKNPFFLPADILSRFFILTGQSWSFFYTIHLMILLLSAIFFLVIDTPFIGFYLEIIQWNIQIPDGQADLFINIFMAFTTMLGFLLVTPFFIIGNILTYYHFKEIHEAEGLEERVAKFPKNY